MSPSYSPEAVRKATGKDWDAWFRVLDKYGLELDHTARAKGLARDHPNLDGWWVQGITVEFEKARGLRVEGQSCDGDFQVSCSRTLPCDVDAAWERVVSAPFLPRADWSEGATWTTPDAEVEVRRVDPGKMLRWFWTEGGVRSTVEVSFVPKGEKTTVVFRHHRLDSLEAREAARVRWKAALTLLR